MTSAAKPRRHRASKAAGNLSYDHAKVEKKARARWDEANCFIAGSKPKNKKFFCCAMFPSLAGPISLGHCRTLVISDIMARMQRMRGKDVLQSVGWETTGLRVRLAAQDAGMPVPKWVEHAKGKGRELLKALGLAIDWSREVATDDPGHKELSQRIFLSLWKSEPPFVKREKQHGVAYWDPGTRSHLSARQLVNGRGPESGMLAEIREVLTHELDVPSRTAKELLEGLERLPHWDAFVKNMQRESIGLEEGLKIPFDVNALGSGKVGTVEVFTSRPDTVMGATYLAVGVNHALALRAAKTDAAVGDFCDKVQNPRYAHLKLGEAKRQEGLPLGLHALNPINGDHIPVWVTNYVVAGYGTGATLGVPGHDQRNYNFAIRHNLPIKQVAIDPKGSLAKTLAAPYVKKTGISINSPGLGGPLNEIKEKLAANPAANGDESVAETKRWERAIGDCVLDFLQERKVGAQKSTVARLRGWKISQDEFWGTPVPLVHCKSCGAVEVPEKDLPIKLPEHKEGKNSLADYPKFVGCKCPRCGNKAKRDTDTLSELFDSSWNFIRMASAKAAGQKKSKESPWLPVDFYCCGTEHATTHLLCSRIMHRYMKSAALAPKSWEPEPFVSLMCQGPVLNYGLPMATWYGNAVDPATLLAEGGTDVLRLLLATSVDPRHPLHWDDDRFFALQGTLSLDELGLFCKGKLKGIKADLASRMLSEREKKRLVKGLLDKEGLARLREATLDAPAMEKVREILDEREIKRLQKGVLDEAGLRALRKGSLASPLMDKVHKILDERELWHLQHGLLDKQKLLQLGEGRLDKKTTAKAQAIVGDKTLRKIERMVAGYCLALGIEKAQKEILDPIESKALERHGKDLELMRKALKVISEGELARIRHGLLDKKSFAALRKGKLDGKLTQKARSIVGDAGIERLQQGVLDMRGMERLYTGKLSPQEKAAAKKAVGQGQLAVFGKSAMGSEKLARLLRALGNIERIERLRKGMLGPEKTKQAEMILGKRGLERFQSAATSLSDESLKKLMGFVSLDKMDKLVSFLDDKAQAKLAKACTKKEIARLKEKDFGFRPRPLLRIIADERMDSLTSHIDEEKMDALVNFLEPDRMEQLLGFPGHLWAVVSSKASLVASSTGKKLKDPRRGMLHKNLKAINAAYMKGGGKRPYGMGGPKDLELSKVFSKARAVLRLLDTACSVDSRKDCEFAAECARVLLLALHPIMPHMTEELWVHLGFAGLACDAPWPKADTRAIGQGMADVYIVQVNGKTKLSFAATEKMTTTKAESKAKQEMAKHSLARGLPKFPCTGEEITDIEWAKGDTEHVINFVTYRDR